MCEHCFWEETDLKVLLETSAFGEKDWGLGGRDTEIFFSVLWIFTLGMHVTIFKKWKNSDAQGLLPEMIIQYI